MFDFENLPADLPIYLILFFLGLLWGSFANVVICRLPEGLSVVRPRSHCPKCKKQIAGYDNVPLLSWFFLRGKCRFCKTSIPIRYPFVEFLMGVLFSTAFHFVGWNWFLLEVLVFLFMLVICSFIDIDHFILPDKLTLPGIGIGLLGAMLNPFEGRTLVDSILGVLLGGGFLWALAEGYAALRKKEGMGGGDIKLLAWMGAVLGWKAIPFIIVASSLVGSVGGLLTGFRNKEGMNAVIPFGPYLVLGALIYLFGGQSLAIWYLSLFIPEMATS